MQFSCKNEDWGESRVATNSLMMRNPTEMNWKKGLILSLN